MTNKQDNVIYLLAKVMIFLPTTFHIQ